MIKVHHNFSLKKYNSFGVNAKCHSFVELYNDDDIRELATNAELMGMQHFVLGNGSNMLFHDYFDGLVIKPAMSGRSIVSEEESTVIVRFSASEVWHDCVEWAVNSGFGGIENLALIPGTIGASPIQNIGAYGAEIGSVIHEVKCFRFDTLSTQVVSNEECRFGYRDSIFKHELKSKCIITSVSLVLQKNPSINLSYSDVANEIAARNIASPGIRDVFNCVVSIRSRKLPDPRVLGNAGSFFKNPVVDSEGLLRLKAMYPDIPSFAIKDRFKIPAAWLIEKCGFKGYRKGDAGVYDRHSLVLVNYGEAHGGEIVEIATEIQNEVERVFDIKLEIEVNIIGEEAVEHRTSGTTIN